MEDRKVVLITGASRGLGKVLLQKMTQAGYKVYGTTREPNHKTLLTMDLNDRDSIQACLADLLAKEGHLDVLVHSAAINQIASVDGTDMGVYESYVSGHLVGSIYLIKACLAHFRQRGQGDLCVIGSLGNRLALPYNSAYSILKQGLDAFLTSLYFELKREASPIHLNWLLPLGLDVRADEPPRIERGNKEVFDGGGADLLYKHFIEGMKPYERREQVAKRLIYLLKKGQNKGPTWVTYKSRLILVAIKIMPMKWFYAILLKKLLKD